MRLSRNRHARAVSGAAIELVVVLGTSRPLFNHFIGSEIRFLSNRRARAVSGAAKALIRLILVAFSWNLIRR